MRNSENDQQKNEYEMLSHMLYAMALCHTIVIDTRKGTYSASSPDELALVNAAAAILDAALDFLKNLGLLGRLSAGKCVQEFLPDGAKDVMGQINNQLAGIESVPIAAGNTIIDTVTSIAPEVSTPAFTRPWINPNTVTNATIGNSNRSLYNTMDMKIDGFSNYNYASSSTYLAPTSSYGSVAASVPSVNNYSTESMTYNPVTRSWE